MLWLACSEAKSTSSADQNIRGTPQARRHQQTCKQRQITSIRLDSRLSDFWRSDGEKYLVEFRRHHFDPGIENTKATPARAPTAKAIGNMKRASDGIRTKSFGSAMRLRIAFHSPFESSAHVCRFRKGGSRYA